MKPFLFTDTYEFKQILRRDAIKANMILNPLIWIWKGWNMLSFSFARFEFNWCICVFLFNEVLYYLPLSFSIISMLIFHSTLQWSIYDSSFTWFSNIRSRNLAFKQQTVPPTQNEPSLYSRESPKAILNCRIKLQSEDQSRLSEIQNRKKRNVHSRWIKPFVYKVNWYNRCCWIFQTGETWRKYKFNKEPSVLFHLKGGISGDDI